MIVIIPLVCETFWSLPLAMTWVNSGQDNWKEWSLPQVPTSSGFNFFNNFV